MYCSQHFDASSRNPHRNPRWDGHYNFAAQSLFWSRLQTILRQGCWLVNYLEQMGLEKNYYILPIDRWRLFQTLVQNCRFLNSINFVAINVLPKASESASGNHNEFDLNFHTKQNQISNTFHGGQNLLKETFVAVQRILTGGISRLAIYDFNWLCQIARIKNLNSQNTNMRGGPYVQKVRAIKNENVWHSRYFRNL